MASLVILTADKLIALDVEGRGKARRAARETPTSRRVLQTFLDRGGPVPVEELVIGLEREPAEAVREALVRLDRRSSSGSQTAGSATHAARPTHSALRRWSASGWRSAPAATTAAHLWSFPQHRRVQDRKR
jgi:hypothetical protein